MGIEHELTRTFPQQIGIVSDRSSPSDFDPDMQRAKSIGIDAFALNIGVDPYTVAQLDLAYQSAANNGMKVFISFDFNWYHSGSDAVAVGQMIARYAGHAAQLMVNGKVFASSFSGDGLDVASMRSAAGVPVFWAPNYHPGQGNVNDVDGALNWMVCLPPDTCLVPETGRIRVKRSQVANCGIGLG